MCLALVFNFLSKITQAKNKRLARHYRIRSTFTKQCGVTYFPEDKNLFQFKNKSIISKHLHFKSVKIKYYRE